jgi:hypothetical protein
MLCSVGTCATKLVAMQVACHDFLLAQGHLLKPIQKKLDAAVALCPADGEGGANGEGRPAPAPAPAPGACTPGAGQDMPTVAAFAAEDGDNSLSVCLAASAAAAVGTVPYEGTSPTVTIGASGSTAAISLSLGCAATEICDVLDRFDIFGAGTAVALRRLRFEGLARARGGFFGGGAVFVKHGALEVHDSAFVHCSTPGQGGAIYAGGTTLRVLATSFAGCGATGGRWGQGGALYLRGLPAGVTLSRLSFEGNTAQLGGDAVVWYGHVPELYTNAEANAAFGAAAPSDGH